MLSKLIESVKIKKRKFQLFIFNTIKQLTSTYKNVKNIVNRIKNQT